jgi:hypothetical protein
MLSMGIPAQLRSGRRNTDPAYTFGSSQKNLMNGRNAFAEGVRTFMEE